MGLYRTNGGHCQRRRRASNTIKGRPHAGKDSQARVEFRQSRIEAEPTEVQVNEGQ